MEGLNKAKGIKKSQKMNFGILAISVEKIHRLTGFFDHYLENSPNRFEDFKLNSELDMLLGVMSA